MRLKHFMILLALALIASACASQYDLVMKSNDVDVKYKAAMEYFKTNKFKKAADIFDNMNLLVQGLPQEDTVNYYHGLANYRYGDFETAEASLAKFVEVYPRSPFVEEAKFFRIDCLYRSTHRWELDQTPARKAMAVISEFMYDNPGSKYYPACQDMMKDLMERLERKSFESAKMYYTMEDYKASHYALKNVLKDNADNQYREDILYYVAMSSYKYALNSIEAKQKERYLNFVDDYYNFVSEYPESKYRKELDGLFAKAEKYVGHTEKKTEEI